MAVAGFYRAERGGARFPGRYAIKRGETLKAVIGRAGGLTDFAFPEGSVFTRVELKRREQEQLDMLAERMQRDLALLALQGAAANQAGAGGALSVGQSLLGQLHGAKAVGRLVIDLPRRVARPDRIAPGCDPARWGPTDRATLPAAGDGDRRGPEQHFTPLQYGSAP